jgi:UDP-N-acetylmuramoylalanine--D-glutamate ligase
VKIYNDNNATTPQATIAGLKALDTGARNIILILGGADKGLDMSELIEAIPVYCKKVILLPGTGTDRFKLETGDTLIYQSVATEVLSLEEALKNALAVGKSGDIILFSPAFASFGLFKNEYDRGDQFVQLVTVAGRTML